MVTYLASLIHMWDNQPIDIEVLMIMPIVIRSGLRLSMGEFGTYDSS